MGLREYRSKKDTFQYTAVINFFTDKIASRLIKWTIGDGNLYQFVIFKTSVCISKQRMCERDQNHIVNRIINGLKQE